MDIPIRQDRKSMRDIRNRKLCGRWGYREKDYIIGNFKNVDPFYEEDEEDDYMYFYTDFNYYDPNLYKEGECDFDDMFDYLDFPKSQS